MLAPAVHRRRVNETMTSSWPSVGRERRSREGSGPRRLRLLVGQQITHAADEHRPYGVNGVMPVEAFRHQALHRTVHRNLIAQRDLILHNNMDDRMYLCVGQVNACAPVEVLDHLEALLL